MKPDSLYEQRDEIIVHLAELNAAVKKQNSVTHIFLTGIIYGVGFVVGSTILATIAIGVFLPFFSDIPWVRDTFMRGSSIMHSER